MKFRPERFTWEPGQLHIVDEEKPVAKTFHEIIEKFNPYHGPDGRFSSADGAASFNFRARVDSGTMGRAIDKETKRTAGLAATGAFPEGKKEPEKKAYTPAKSIKEAEQQLRDMGVAYVNFKGFDLEIANGIVEQYGILKERYPESVERIKCVTTTQERNRLLKRHIAEQSIAASYGGREQFIRGVMAGHIYNATGHSIESFAAANPKLTREQAARKLAERAYDEAVAREAKHVKTGSVSANEVASSTNSSWGPYEGISYNAGQVKSAARLTGSWQRNESTGFHPKGTADIRSIFTHEAGHQIDNILSQHPGKRERVVRDAIKEAEKTLGGVGWEVSKYATKNSNEFFAEAFSEYIHSTSPRPIAMMVGKALDIALADIRGGK